MAMPYEWMIGTRYLRSQHRSGFVSFVASMSVIGLALGVAVLVVVLSVLNGFETELRSRMLSVTSHATISGLDGEIADWREAQDQLARVPGVRAVAPYIEARGLLSHGQNVAGTLVRGVEPAAEGAAIGLGSRMREGALADLEAGKFNVILGSALAAELGVKQGDSVVLMTPEATATPAGLMPRMRRFVVSGIFESGAPNALLAATRPELVHSIVWTEPNPRFAWAPDWPWGRTSRDMERELEDLELWGTIGYGRAFVADEASRGNELSDGLENGSFAAWMAKASRNACTPDVARALAQIWYETDIRALLPSIQVPTLIQVKADSPEDTPRARHVASLIPGAELQEMPAGSWTEEDMRVSADGIRRFVGAERPPLELDTILSTVLFTDIVGSTQMQAALGDHGWKELIEQHHAIVRGSLVRWHGVENDTAGDGFYATFDGPARAIRCAQEVGERVRDLGIEIRAGVHTGECELIDGKVGGLAVTIGSRVAATAGPSEVRISQTVKDLVAGSGLTFEDAGEHELKGVPDRWRLYRVAV